MTPLRIVLVSEISYPAGDATSTTLKATLDRLVDLGHTPSLVASAPGLASYRGVPVHRISTVDRVGAQVHAVLTAVEPDVVLVLSPGRVGRKALKHARRLGVPTLVVEHSPLIETSADYWRRKVAGRADRVLVTSAWMQHRLSELDVDVALWSPGVDVAAFTPALRDEWLHDRWSGRRSRDGARVVVGYVGGLHRGQGVRRLSALGDLPDVRLVVIGDGPERAWLEARLPGARFLGTLQTGDLTVALPSLDVLVHPSEHQTCAHVLREAAASGVPVVAPRTGAAPEVVRDGETGALYDPRDRRALADTVGTLVRDPQRSRLGTSGRAAVSARTWVDAVDELLTDHLGPLAVAATPPTSRRRAAPA